MGLTPLALVGGTPHDTERYNNWLEGRLAEVSPLLVANPVWSNAMMDEVFGHPWLSQTYASMLLNPGYSQRYGTPVPPCVGRTNAGKSTRHLLSAIDVCYLRCGKRKADFWPLNLRYSFIVPPVWAATFYGALIVPSKQVCAPWSPKAVSWACTVP